MADLGTENANQPVSGTITVDGEEYLYNFNGVRTDAYGKLYLYLFAGEAVLTVNGFKFAGAIDADNQTLQPVLGGSIYFNEATPYQDQLTVNTNSVTPASCRDNLTYTWYRCDDKTGAGATLIEGAAGSTYTLTEADQGKYIKVEVSAPGYEAYPLTTVSHQVDSSITSTILRITGVTLGAKTYDGTGDFDVQDVAFDVATLTKDTDYTATASLEGANYAVGGNKTVTVTVTLQNKTYTFEENQTVATYTLTNQVVAPATLTVASAAAVSRSVNDTATVNITGVTLDGVVEGDDVAVATTGLTGELSGSEAGTYETVTLPQTLTLTGADADNYLLTQPAGAVTLDPFVTLWVRDGTVVQIDGVYQIETKDDLFWFAGLVNGTLTDDTPQDIAASAVLLSDITITEGRDWTPIGNKSAGTSQYYIGTFDGQGFTIDGLVVNNPDSNYQGFVGYMVEGTIRNLTLGENCSVDGNQCTGGICGYIHEGTTENCTFNGTVTGNYRYTGGICGEIYNGTIQNCTNNGLVESVSYSVGGICGYNYYADISECINNASVTGTSYTGGICGDNYGTVTNCINNGKVTGTGSMGGIVGYCGAISTTTGTVSNCINKGSLSGGTNRGGICGWNNNGNITNCYWLNTAYSGYGIGKNEGTSESVASKTSTQFASGEVTWLLNNSTSEGDLAWYQNLDNGKTVDAYPVLDSSHGTVYCVKTTSEVYTNDPNAKVGISNATVTLSESSFPYDGTEHKPTVTVKLGNEALVENTDYTVTYGGDTTNAGTVTVTVTGKGDYSGTASKTYTIQKATVTPSISGTASKTYDGTDTATGLSITLQGVLGNDVVTATAASYTYNSANVGENKTITANGITLGGSSAGNYALSTTTATTTGTITPAALTVTASDQTKTYGNADPELTYTVTEGTLFGTDTLTGALTRATGENVGEYAINQGTLSNSNYTITFTGAQLTITARPVVLEWSEQTSFTYDGSEYSVTAEVTNKVVGDTVELTYTGNTATAVGSYTAAVTGLGNANYTLDGATNTSQEWNISEASIAGATVTLSQNSFTYNGGTQKPTVTVTLGGMTLTEGSDYTVTYDGDTTNAGTVTVTVTGTGNYSGTAGEKPTYTIEKATVTPSISGTAAKTYDGTTAADGLSITLEGVVTGDTVTATAASYAYNSANVAEANIVTASGITLGGSGAGNYVLSSETARVSGTITPAVLTVTANDQSKTYGEDDPELTYQANGLIGDDKLEGTLIRTTGEDVGQYAITQGTLSNSNYTITFTSATLTITARPVVLEWGTTSFTYDGSEHSVTAEVTNKAGGDTVELTYSDNTATAVGTYIATVTGLGNANYTLVGATNTSQEWNISEASITAAAVTLSQDSFTYDGREHRPTVTVTLGGMTLIEGTDYTVTYDGDTTNAGTVTVTVTGAGNYSGTAESKPTYTIEKATVTPSISGTASKTYDGTTAADGLSITLEGVVTGDTVTAAADSYTYDSANAGEGKTITASGITLGGSSAGNYVLSDATATTTGTITPASLTVTAEAKTRTYGDADPELTYQTVGLIDGDTLTGELARDAGEDVGEYAITQGTLSNSNYTITFTGAKLTISARPVVLEWGTTSFTYDGSEHSVTAEVTNKVGGDTVELTYTGNTAIAVGSYTATVTGLSNANYTLVGATNTSQEWNISEASIAGAVVTLSQNSFTYNGGTQKPAVTVTLGGMTLTEGTDYTVTYDGDTTNAGTVTVTVTGRGSYSGEAAASYIILPAPLAITGATLAEKTYDGSTDAVVTSVTFREYTLTMGTDFTATAVYDSADAGTRSAAVTVTLNNGNFTLESSTYQLTNQTIAKADYDGGKEAFGTVTAAMPGSVDLPAIPAGAGYGEPSGDAVTGLAISGNTLSYIGSGSIEKDQTYIITVPVNGGTNFNDYTITVTLTGDKKVPTGAPTLSADTITYGETLGTITLSGSMLDGEEAVTGTFTWDAPETVPDAGSYQAQWTFVPDNSDLYVSVKGSVEITVEKATPTGAPQYTAITTSGKTLADAKLTTEGGTFSVEGAVAWELDDTTQVQANTAYKWIFTPADGDNYNSISGTVVLWYRSSNSGSSSSSTTETEKNPDGSTTTTVTKPDGTTTETTKWPDGSQEVIETDKDGTVTTTTTDSGGNKTQVVENTDGSKETTVTNKDGSGSVTVVDADGGIISQATLSEAAVEAAQAAGEAVALPMPAVPVTTDQENAPTVTVDLPSSGSAKVEVPVEDVTSGTVAVLVKDDGTEAVIKTSVTTENGVAATLSDGDTVKIVDNSKDFADVPDTYWGVEAVDFATSRELFVGTSAATFEPDTDMSRGMIVTVLARFEGVDTSSGDIWYEAGQQWAIGNGVSDGTNMDQILTREQLATMLWRYAGSPDVSGSLEGYTDADLVSDWAVQGMLWAVEQGIINGTTTTTLSPQNPATRAQAATILMRFIQGMV